MYCFLYNIFKRLDEKRQINIGHRLLKKKKKLPIVVELEINGKITRVSSRDFLNMLDFIE